MQQSETAANGVLPAAPFFTDEEVNQHIVTEGYFTALDALSKGAMLQMPNVRLIETHGNEPDVQFSVRALGSLMLCVLVTRNGFTVTGTSICMDPERFDPEIAMAQARQSAVRHLIPYLAFHVRTEQQAAENARLQSASATGTPSLTFPALPPDVEPTH